MKKWSEMIGLKTDFNIVRNYEVPRVPKHNNYGESLVEVSNLEIGVYVPKFGFQSFKMIRDYKNGEMVGIHLTNLKNYIHQNITKNYLHFPKKFNFNLAENLLNRYAYEWMKLNEENEFSNIAVINILLTNMNRIMEQEI